MNIIIKAIMVQKLEKPYIFLKNTFIQEYQLRLTSNLLIIT